MRRYFGTDGVRGVANVVLTPELAFQLGRAGGYVISRNNPKVDFVVGRDTRASGEMLEAALIAGLTSVGINVIRLGVIPTPAVAYLTKKIGAAGGAMISASHNPFEDNGIKFFNQEGYKLSDETEEEIEHIIINNVELPKPSGEKIGRVIELEEGKDSYIKFLKSTIPKDFSGLKVVLDCANGAATSIAPTLFESLNAKLIVLSNNPDGININVNCGSTHPEALQKAVIKEKADIGLAFDGDADRLIAVDNNGDLVDGDQILFACATYLKEKNKLKNNTVVSTVMSNFGFKRILEEKHINNVQTNVGDRYVLESMMNNHYSLGGEQSGHIIFLDYNTTGDGLLSAIQLVNIMKEKKATLSSLVSEFKKFPQKLVNVKVSTKENWDKNSSIQTAIQNSEKKLNGNGRILVRASGTENIIRVMAEAETEEIVNELVTDISETIKKEIQ